MVYFLHMNGPITDVSEIEKDQSFIDYVNHLIGVGFSPSSAYEQAVNIYQSLLHKGNPDDVLKRFREFINKQPGVVQEINIGPFQPLTANGFVMAVSRSTMIVDGEHKNVVFGMSTAQAQGLENKDPYEPAEQAKKTLNQGVDKRFEIDGVYYFEYTDSHFEEQPQKPVWAI